MGCGCTKNKTVLNPARARTTNTTVTTTVVSYDVHTTDGNLVASFSNLTTAQTEALRIGGTVTTRGTTIPTGTVTETAATPTLESEEATRG